MGYDVSNEGRVRGWKHSCGSFLKIPRILHLYPNQRGHLWFDITKKGQKKKKQYIHRLVLENFISKCPQKKECCHNDGNPSNNNLHNLRWDTRVNNQADRKIHGTSNEGSNHGMSKLSEKDVLNIRMLSKKGLSQRKIGKQFGVRGNNISRIINRKSWKHVKECA